MLTINDNTNTPRNVLEVEDLEAAKCACTTGKIQPLISVTGPLSGSGSLAAPVGLAGGVVGQVLTSNGAGQATFQNAAAGAQTPVTVTTNTCIAIGTSGVDNHTLAPSLIISPAISGRNNAASCTATGFFAPELQITSDNTCALGGVGPAFMIKNITDVGNNIFNINGASEHTNVVGSGTAVTAGGDFTANVTGPSSDATITAPACRDLRVIAICRGSFNIVHVGPSFYNGAVFFVELDSGAGFVPIGAYPSVNGQAVAGDSGQYYFGGPIIFLTGILPAGTSYTYRLRANMVTGVAPSGIVGWASTWLLDIFAQTI